MSAVSVIRTTAALLATLVAAGALAGCGASAGAGGSGAATKPADPKPFPDLGYRYVPPRLPAHVPPSAVLLVDMTNTAGVRPAQLRFASDGTLSEVRWTAWGSAQAVGHGTATVRICTSSCGAGHDQRYPATITLAGIKLCSGKRFYQGAQVSLDARSGRIPWGAYIHAPC